MFGKKKRKSKKQDGRGEGQVEGQETAVAGDGSAAEVAPPAGPPCGGPGWRMGGCTIESALGQGGMGRVYLAGDPVIGRNVALKVISIRPDLSDEGGAQCRERFLREAQAAGALL